MNMPSKELKPFVFSFDHNGKEYLFNTFRIFRNRQYICDCDLTVTEFYGNYDITLMCCKIALNALGL